MNEHDLGYATRFNVEHAENEMVVAIEGQRVSFNPMEAIPMGTRWVEYAIDKGWAFHDGMGNQIGKIEMIDSWIAALKTQRERLIVAN